MPSPILTPEEVRSCERVFCGAHTGALAATIQHAALLGARKAFPMAWDDALQMAVDFGILERPWYIPVKPPTHWELRGVSGKDRADKFFPLPLPARVPRKVPVSGGREVWYEAGSYHISTHEISYSELRHFAYAFNLTRADIAAIAGLPDNPCKEE